MKWYEKVLDNMLVRNAILEALNEERPQNSFQETFQLRKENEQLKDRLSTLESANFNLRIELENKQRAEERIIELEADLAEYRASVEQLLMKIKGKEKA